MSVLRAFFWWEFFPAFGLNMESYRASPRIHSECGVIWARPTPNANAFYVVDVRTLLYYYNTIVFKIYSYKLAEWLWRHETSSSNSRCFLSLIPEYIYVCCVCVYRYKQYVYDGFQPLTIFEESFIFDVIMVSLLIIHGFLIFLLFTLSIYLFYGMYLFQLLQ